uniref:hypothetical protein n=1 Tax=uncultured Erythrobacter sp. TaxID=263913 RepID=UPI00261835D7|nr:hypothetical protein [uncultured Erythrobacter sp.]
MTRFSIGAEQEQTPFETEPYDSWVSPDGECQCEFHRTTSGFLLRFPDQADFLVEPEAGRATGWPSIFGDRSAVQKLFDNSIVPLLGNYDGGLFLHGSAVQTQCGAAAFLGHSRSGKTTLAGSFARSGQPFMTEDVVDLAGDGEGYVVRSKTSALRLFKDSAEHLLGRSIGFDQESGKQSIEAEKVLPFAHGVAKLAAIFVLGNDHGAPLNVRPQPAGVALPLLLPHAFILDVEDRPRLREHFGRLAELAERVPVFALDYPREYSVLPQVRSAILSAIQKDSTE